MSTANRLLTLACGALLGGVAGGICTDQWFRNQRKLLKEDLRDRELRLVHEHLHNNQLEVTRRIYAHRVLNKPMWVPLRDKNDVLAFASAMAAAPAHTRTESRDYYRSWQFRAKTSTDGSEPYEAFALDLHEALPDSMTARFDGYDPEIDGDVVDFHVFQK